MTAIDLCRYNLSQETKDDFQAYLAAKKEMDNNPSPDNRYEFKRSYESVFNDVKAEKSVHKISQQELDELINSINEVIDG